MNRPIMTGLLAMLLLPMSSPAAEMKNGMELASPVSASSIVQVMLGLVFVLVIIAASAFMLRRFGRFSSFDNGALKILATLSMGPRDRIVLLQAGDKQLLVGISPGRMQTLCELDEPIDLAEGDEKSPGFQQAIMSAFKAHSSGSKH